MSKAPHPPAQEYLSEKQLFALLETPETFATYLASLSPEQVRLYKKRLEDCEMDDVPKKAIGAILDLTEKEAVLNLEEYKKAILPEAKRLASCIKMFETLQQLEALSKNLS